MTVYILTRTSGRPRMFSCLRDSIRSQNYQDRVVHAVHSDSPADTYVYGDIVVNSRKLQKSSQQTAPWEVFNKKLLQSVLDDFKGEGYVIFLDDDDLLYDESTLREIVKRADKNSLNVFLVEREKGRISPERWKADIKTMEGRICWEAGVIHTNHIQKALMHDIDGRDGGDGRFWMALSEHLPLKYHPLIITRPQKGKGHGRCKDA
ncbi:MAG: glycosyltransferase [Actinobacteria bacterium]|nr:glycosyltransferase [Actinomycetota bacterium]